MRELELDDGIGEGDELRMREGGEGLKGLAEPECQSVRTVEAVIFYLSRLRGKGEKEKG